MALEPQSCKPGFSFLFLSVGAMSLVPPSLVDTPGLENGTPPPPHSLFGFAAKMPPVYSQALMGGNGIAGVIVAVIRIVTYAAMPSDTEKSSMIYFMCSGGVVFLCILCFFILLRMPFTRYYITQNPADSVCPFSSLELRAE